MITSQTTKDTVRDTGGSTRRAGTTLHARTVHHPTFADVVRAEWVKIRTVRSTLWTLVALVVLSVGITALGAAAAAPDLARYDTGEQAASFLTLGLMFGQVAAVVFGVMSVSAEYATGTMLASVTAAPRRGQLVLAKAVVVSGILLVLGTVTAVLSYGAGNAFLSAEGLGVGLGEDGVLRALAGGGLYLAALGLFGMGLGLLVRHTAGAITVAMGVLFVLSNVVMLLPGSLGEWATKLMPGNAGFSITAVIPFAPGLLDPWTGFAVFVAQTALLVGAGVWAFRSRDA